MRPVNFLRRIVRNREIKIPRHKVEPSLSSIINKANNAVMKMNRAIKTKGRMTIVELIHRSVSQL